jgi:hypothetical protein
MTATVSTTAASDRAALPAPKNGPGDVAASQRGQELVLHELGRSGPKAGWSAPCERDSPRLDVWCNVAQADCRVEEHNRPSDLAMRQRPIRRRRNRPIELDRRGGPAARSHTAGSGCWRWQESRSDWPPQASSGSRYGWASAALSSPRWGSKRGAVQRAVGLQPAATDRTSTSSAPTTAGWLMHLSESERWRPRTLSTLFDTSEQNLQGSFSSRRFALALCHRGEG